MNPQTRHYAIVTLAYWVFTLSDGAVRMMALLHFHALGYTPITLSMLFLLYEAAGIGANLIGGWLATRFGVTRMLLGGLLLQIVGLGVLSALSVTASGPIWMSLTWVMLAQGLCGIAKDLTKTASKTAIKLTASPGRLFKWVALFTGSKNAMKGLGFFLGGVLLESVGFEQALWGMAVVLAGVALAVCWGVPRLMGQGRASKSARALLVKTRGLHVLAAARIALFGARDLWFAVGVPLFLYNQGWRFAEVSAFLALWTIGYGLVQALTPTWVSRSADGLSREVPAARRWATFLVLPPALLAWGVWGGIEPLAWWVVAGLSGFGVVFAVNSSVHSYLVLAYAGTEKAAEDVGFYYAANAVGRLMGTVLSGALFQAAGLFGTLVGCAVLLSLGALVTRALPQGPPSGHAAAHAS